MFGARSARHSIYRMVDKNSAANKRSKNFKENNIQQAIYQLNKTELTTLQKVQYLKSLPKEFNCNAQKYSYKCSIEECDIEAIIRATNNDELYEAYYRRPIKNKWFYDGALQQKIILILIIVFFLWFILAFIFSR